MEKDKKPLIEYFLVIGLSNQEINQTLELSSIDISKIQQLPLRILEEYKSNRLQKSSNNKPAYINSILTFCFPKGVDIKETHSIYLADVMSFTIFDEDKRKHVTCLSFYENYLIDNKPFAIQKCFCLVSSKELYATHKQILSNLYNIVTSSKINPPKYIFLKDKVSNCKYTVIQESKILEFYISFFLNTLWYSPMDSERKGVCVKYAKNNSGYSLFANYHIENNSQLPIKDYDMSLLVDTFEIDDLISIYIGLLIEYKVIIVFEDYSEINQILFSLVSLLYPLDWKLLPLITFITKGMIEMLEAPLAIIMGVHISFLPEIYSRIKEGSITSNSLVYNVTQKRFIFISKHFPKLTYSIYHELHSDLEALLFERKTILSQFKLCDMNTHTYSDNHGQVTSSNDNNIDFYNIFQLNGEYISLSPIVYFNYKLVSIFYKSFLNIISNIDKCINWDMVNKLPVIKPKTQLSEYFDYNKFKNDIRCINDSSFTSFMKNFAGSMNLTEFIWKYLFKCFNKNKGKYFNVHYMISLFNHTNSLNIKEETENFMKIKMIEAICNYYNYTYVSLDNAITDYLKVFKELSISKRDINKGYLIWPPIEIYKVMSKTFSYADYIITSSINSIDYSNHNDDENNNILPSEKTFNELNELCNNIQQTNIDTCSSNNNMNKSKSSDKKSSTSFKQKEFLDILLNQFNAKSPSFSFDTRSENMSSLKINYHRHTSSQSYDNPISNLQPSTISFCLESKHSHEQSSSSKFKLQFLASAKVDLNVTNIKIKPSKKSITSFSPQIEINDTSTLGETIKESISDSLFTRNNSNPFKRTITLVVPVKKETGKSAKEILSSTNHIDRMQKLEGDDDMGVFSDG